MRVLIVEDEPIISLNLQTMVLDLGYRPVAASTLKEAFATLYERRIDVAILDVSLPDGDSMEIAKTLVGCKVPFVFATGLFLRPMPDLPNVEILQKPYDGTMLATALEALKAKKASIKPEA